jgi:hypothetical protein
MKTLKIISIFLITSLLAMGCNNKPRIKKSVKYPDVISPIYFLDTFQIKSPRVAIVDSKHYIFSLEKLEPFENQEDFINQIGVIQYLPPWMYSSLDIGYIQIYKTRLREDKSFYSLARKNDIEIEFNEMFFQQADSIQDIPVFEFVFKPKTFLLTLISTKYHGDLHISPIEPEELDEPFDPQRYFYPAVFVTDYMLALMPIYNKRDLREINKYWYRHFTGKDPDWTFYLPDWIQTLLSKLDLDR